MDSIDRIHSRIIETKWRALTARGLVRPRSLPESLSRLEEADRLPRGSKPGNEQQASSVAEVSLS